MKGNYCWSDLQQTVLWMLLIPSLCLDINVLHTCQTDGDTAEAGSEGSIVSPPGLKGYYLICPLRLTGVLERSWFGLYVETLALPCTSTLRSNTEWGTECTTDKSYIKIAYLYKKICQPSETSNLYYYKNNAGPVTVKLYSERFTSEHSFNLTYRVASVIDIGEDAPLHAVDTTDQQSGYVVSHSTYGNENYGGNINSNLTLTNLHSNSIEFHLFDLDLRPNNCADKLIIYGLYTTIICADDRFEYVDKWKYFETINNKVTFQFVSDSHSTATESGFMFKYGVLETQPSPSPLVPTNTHKATLETPMSTQRRETAVLTESTAKAKAGAALLLAVTTPSPFDGAWFIPFGVGMGSGLALGVVISVAAIALKKRRNRKYNTRTRNLNEERTESGNDFEMTVIEVANTGNDNAAAEVVEDLEPSPRDEQDALLTNQKMHSNVDIQSVRNETEIASETQNTSVRTADEDNIYQFADENDED